MHQYGDHMMLIYLRIVQFDIGALPFRDTHPDVKRKKTPAINIVLVSEYSWRMPASVAKTIFMVGAFLPGFFLYVLSWWMMQRVGLQ